ncbi:MAG TPA: molecular chaperone DnaJ, partial [Gemmatimonadetes bacterium]|nr:molecular chaperone DnaJ [Gemmatimonadota bacterium]
MATGTKDFYKTLGVSEKSNQAEIKSAYRTLAKKYHPDANPGNAKAAGRFKGIGEAYAVLSDPEKRKHYDQISRIPTRGFGRGGGAPRGSAAPSSGGFSFEDLEGFGGLGDIFSSIFDRRPKAAAPETNSGPAKGRSIEYSVEISFLTAVKGDKISIDVPITEGCATCGGSGASPGMGSKKCGECKGTGAISFGQGGFALNRPCPACFGRGEIPESPCNACSGSGTVRQNRRFKITVP